MSDLERAVAWATEMRAVHQRLRDALEVARDAVEDGEGILGRDLLLHCWGFCAALSGHHAGEDSHLFPAVLAGHPELEPVLMKLRQDHSMIEHLLGAFRAAVDARADPAALLGHVEGIEAVMESHFGYEERQLLGVLETTSLDAEPGDVFGPL
ncbi:hemerythrin domain-containing protein [Nocardioides sp. LHG3406-4]|uniref:hemerythrin domain-containing protein n=1 Tax=Nocardioides sp. LHG3406-4 TaxID=2804575 RepID=UPI003CEEF9F5